MIETDAAHRAAAGRCPCVAAVLLALFAAGCAGPPVAEADAGATDVFAVELRRGEGSWETSPPVRLTDRDGYDNQPAFSADGATLWYVSRSGIQADVHAYDLSARRSRRVTRTLESEYSPAAIPGDERFSVVRVERDGRQRVWAFGGSDDLPELLLPRPHYVGYHAWVDARTAVVTVLGEPNRLHTVTLDDEISPPLAEDVGRSLQAIPGRRAVSFVAGAGGDMWIHALDVDTGETTRLVAALPGAEDHAWLPDGDLVMAQGARLYRYGPGTLGLWSEMADYGGDDVDGITRLAVHPEGRLLAFVAAH